MLLEVASNYSSCLCSKMATLRMLDIKPYNLGLSTISSLRLYLMVKPDSAGKYPGTSNF